MDMFGLLSEPLIIGGFIKNAIMAVLVILVAAALGFAQAQFPTIPQPRDQNQSQTLGRGLGGVP
jgi:hypothetical protein